MCTTRGIAIGPWHELDGQCISRWISWFLLSLTCCYYHYWAKLHWALYYWSDTPWFTSSCRLLALCEAGKPESEIYSQQWSSIVDSKLHHKSVTAVSQDWLIIECQQFSLAIEQTNCFILFHAALGKWYILCLVYWLLFWPQSWSITQ